MTSEAIYRRTMGQSYELDDLIHEMANGFGPSARQHEADDDGYDTSHGADLLINLNKLGETTLEGIHEQILTLEAKQYADTLTKNDIDWSMHDAVVKMREDYHRQFARMAEDDKKYASAVQDWVMDELKRIHPDYSPENSGITQERLAQYLYETIQVIDRLILELAHEQEDEKLIELAQTWRLEMLADYDAAELRRLYALAA